MKSVVKVALFTALLLVSTINTVHAQSPWVKQQIFTKLNLNDVHFIDSASGWIAADSGMVFQTTNGGQFWYGKPKATTKNLRGIHFTDSKTGVAVGDSGTIIYTTNGGDSWTLRDAQTSFHFFGLSFASDTLGFAVGQNGVIRRTTNAGQTWGAMTTGTTKSLFAMSTPNIGIATIVGEGGIAFHGNYGNIDDFTFRYFYGGDSLLAIDILDIHHGIAVGQNGRLLRTAFLYYYPWDSLQRPTDKTLHGVIMLDSNSVITVGDGGTILFSRNMGENWQQVTSPVSTGLRAISFSDPNNGTIVGTNGTVLRTTTGGMTSVERIEPANGDNSFDIYPNPARDFITIGSVDQEHGPVSVTIYNALFQLEKRVVTKGRIITSDLPNGTYYVFIAGSDFSTIKRLVVTH